MKGRVKDRIPALAEKADLDIISWHCTWTGPDVEGVDITLELGKHEPLDLDEIEKHHEDHCMKMENYIRVIAGTFVLASLGLSRLHSEYWLFFTAFVGANLLQSGLTRWCLMENILAKVGVAKPAG